MKAAPCVARRARIVCASAERDWVRMVSSTDLEARAWCSHSGGVAEVEGDGRCGGGDDAAGGLPEHRGRTITEKSCRSLRCVRKVRGLRSR